MRSTPYLKHVVFFLVGTVIFALAYAQAPLYFSNQNQYFVHGLAEAGYGYLDQDWLANTADPTPIFSFLVAASYRFLSVNLFYVYYALLMGIYFLSLFGLFHVFAGERATFVLQTVFVAFFLLLHSALMRSMSARLLGVDYPWYFQAGVAGQYVLGPMLQPSAFGVLLILSLYLFARQKSFLAVTCSSLGAVCHATYLLPAAMLTLSYMVVLASEKQRRKSLLVGIWALVLVLPVVIYNFINFRPTLPETFAEAQQILVHFRMPHHTIPRLWFDWIAAAQIVWMIFGIALSYGNRLFPVLVITFVIAAILTLIQIVTDNNTLALLFPWRVSVILMPVATTIILTRLILLMAKTFRNPMEEKLTVLASFVIVVCTVAGGVMICVYGLAFQSRDEELAVMDYVKEHKSPKDVYLLPVPVPNLEASVHGSYKSDFKPLPALEKNAQFIPVNLQRFRLYTGAPIFVDFKSIPYRDIDVLKWRERLRLNQKFYKELKASRMAKVLPELRQRGITHILMPAREPLRGSSSPVVYADRYYRIYRVPAGGQ